MNSDRESYQRSARSIPNDGVLGEDANKTSTAGPTAPTDASDNNYSSIGLTSSQSADSMNVSSVSTAATTTSSSSGILAPPSKRRKTENGWFGIAGASLFGIAAIVTSSDPFHATASGAVGFVAGMYIENIRKRSRDESSCDCPDDTNDIYPATAKNGNDSGRDSDIVLDHLTSQSPTSTTENGNDGGHDSSSISNDVSSRSPTTKKNRKKKADKKKKMDAFDALLEAVGGDEDSPIRMTLETLKIAVNKNDNRKKIREKLKKVALEGNEGDSPEQIANDNKSLKDEVARSHTHNTQLQKNLDDCNKEIEKLKSDNRAKENKIHSLQTNLETTNTELLQQKRLTMKGEACTILQVELARQLRNTVAPVLGGSEPEDMYAIVNHRIYNTLGRHFLRPNQLDPPRPNSNCPIEIFERRVLPLAEDMHRTLVAIQNERNHQNHLVVEELIPSVVDQMKDDLEDNIGIKGVNEGVYKYVRDEILAPVFNKLQTKLKAKAIEQQTQRTTLGSPRPSPRPSPFRR